MPAGHSPDAYLQCRHAEIFSLTAKNLAVQPIFPNIFWDSSKILQPTLRKPYTFSNSADIYAGLTSEYLYLIRAIHRHKILDNGLKRSLNEQSTTMGRIPKRKRSSEALNITDIGTTDKTIEQARAQPDPVVPSKGRRALDHVKKRVGAAADAARDSVKKIHALAPRTGPVPPVDLRSWVLTAATTQAPQPSGPFPKPPGLEKGLYDRQIMAEFNTIPSLRPTDFAQRRLLDGAGYEEPLRDLFLPHSYSGKSTTPRACMMNGLSIYIQVTLFFRELWAQAPTPAHMEFGARLMGGIFDLHSTKVHRFDGYFKFKPEHVRRRLVQQASMKRSTDPAITRAAGLWELALHVATQHALFLKDQKDTPGPQGFTAEETTFFDRLEKLSVVYGSPAASQSFKILPRDPRDPLWVDELASRIYQVKDLLCGSDILLGVWGPKTRNLHHAVRNITMNRELEVKGG